MADGSNESPRLPTTSITGAVIDTVTSMSWFRGITFGQVIIMAFVAGGFYLVYWVIDKGLPAHEQRTAEGFQAINTQNIAALNALTTQNAEALKSAANLNALTTQNAEALKSAANLNAAAITTAATLHAEAIKSAALLSTESVKAMTDHAEKASARRERETAKNEQLLRELFGMKSAKSGVESVP